MIKKKPDKNGNFFFGYLICYYHHLWLITVSSKYLDILHTDEINVKDEFFFSSLTVRESYARIFYPYVRDFVCNSTRQGKETKVAFSSFIFSLIKYS